MSTENGVRLAERYSNGEYLKRNPSFHIEDAEFKATQVLRMLGRHDIATASVCDVGCGAGEVLRLLRARLPGSARYHGYELSPEGFRLCEEREEEGLKYFNASVAKTERAYDLLLCLDVFEHVDDPLGFLRSLKAHADHFVFHIPLDMNAQSVLRGTSLLHVREKLGHLHYYTRGTAMATLEDSGHEVVDWFYTPVFRRRPRGLGAKLAWLPRALAYALHRDFAVRALGGYSIMVLTR